MLAAARAHDRRNDGQRAQRRHQPNANPALAYLAAPGCLYGLCALVRHDLASPCESQAARPAKLTGPAGMSVQYPGRASYVSAR
jgi:hypothetical protein